jgi:hypothetical protein
MAGRFIEVLVEKFIASFKTPPAELVLDFDATDDRVHGMQEGRFFHGYYGDYCFLPLYVYCGEQLLVSYLRPSDQDGAKHAGVVLRLLVKRLRRAWPNVKITWRADSGFCRWRVLSWCERHDVQYIVGLAKNSRLLEASQRLMLRAERQYKGRVGNKDCSRTSNTRPRPGIMPAYHCQSGALGARFESAISRHEHHG